MNIRPWRAVAVTLTLRLALRWCRLRLSRRVLDLLAKACTGSVCAKKQHAGCEEC